MSAKNPKNSLWHKGNPRPRPWWVGIVKEERQTKRAENPAAKNAKYTTAYNVLVGGTSVGMTFDLAEARAWAKTAATYLKPQVVRVPYVMPN